MIDWAALVLHIPPDLAGSVSHAPVVLARLPLLESFGPLVGEATRLASARGLILAIVRFATMTGHASGEFCPEVSSFTSDFASHLSSSVSIVRYCCRC